MPEGERRLAAIMFTDIVGYTSLVQRDESTTLQALEDHRKLLRPHFTSHGGHEVKTIGDAFLVEFQSALDAVLCAVAIQQMMHDRKVARGDALSLRIGIHVGDVVESSNDILGDAVNIASRIEPFAPPGGICVSQQVYDQVHNKFEFPLTSLGEKELKNVTSRVEIYRVVLPWERQSAGSPDLDRTRIAVLPFSNISPDPADEYFADGMTEELIATMSRVGGLKVIARTSVMGYKGGQKKISDVARELEVGSVLEGSVRKAGDKVRITIQLIDSRTSEHLWAESYERELKDIFVIQSEVSNVVAQALKVHLTPQEKSLVERSQTRSPEAHTLYLKGRFLWNERTREGVERALAYFEKSVEADPGFALAYSGIADCYNTLVDYGWMSPQKAAPMALENARRALSIDESLPEAHASLGFSLAAHWLFREAEREYQRAIELRPNYSPAYHWYAILLAQLGRPEESMQKELKALEVDPFSLTSGLGLAISYYLMERYPEALLEIQKLEKINTSYSGIPFWKSAILTGEEDRQGAIREAKRGVQMNPSPIMILNLAQCYGIAGMRDEALSALEEGKRKGYSGPAVLGVTEIICGMPEEGFVHLRKALDEKDYSIFLIMNDPIIRPFLSGRRFDEIRDELSKFLT